MINLQTVTPGGGRRSSAATVAADPSIWARPALFLTVLLFGTHFHSVAAAALAQERYDTAPLPAICAKDAMAAMGDMKTNSSSGAMAMPTDPAHKDLAAGMAKMRSDMSLGMQAKDIDVAFNCSMLAHHQGAIAMARVELKYGKDAQNRALAEEIIKAQEKQVGQMLAWLERRSK